MAAVSDTAVEKLLSVGTRNQWYAICPTHFVTEKPLSLRRCGYRMVLWRGLDGTPYALEDRCPHRGMRLSFGFVRGNLRRVHLEVIASNTAAIRSYEKAGFVVEGRQREHAWVRGHYEDMVRMGAVNEAVDHERLEEVALEYAADIARQSPQAIRMLKFAFNLADDGLAGQQVFAGEATRLAYMTDEAVEGKEAFLQKRDPDWSNFPYYF